MSLPTVSIPLPEPMEQEFQRICAAMPISPETRQHMRLVLAHRNLTFRCSECDLLGDFEEILTGPGLEFAKVCRHCGGQMALGIVHRPGADPSQCADCGAAL